MLGKLMSDGRDRYVVGVDLHVGGREVEVKKWVWEAAM